jgi:hypothetical protein
LERMFHEKIALTHRCNGIVEKSIVRDRKPANSPKMTDNSEMQLTFTH